jgi:hypothetical protein
MGDQVRIEQREASELLDREWDPIGVYQRAGDEQAPPGEYDTYAGWIVNALRTGGGKPEVLRLMESAREAMGLGETTRLDDRAADKLLRWWEQRTS